MKYLLADGIIHYKITHAHVRQLRSRKPVVYTQTHSIFVPQCKPTKFYICGTPTLTTSGDIGFLIMLLSQRLFRITIGNKMKTNMKQINNT